MGKRGRKTTFNEKFKETIVRLSKEGKTMDQIAEVVGVTSRTLTNWMGTHQDLFLAVRESRMLADELVEIALFQRAQGYSHPEEKAFFDSKEGVVVTHPATKHYPPDTQAAVFWLRNRQPEKWKEKTEGDVNVNNNLQVNNLNDEQLDAKIQKLLGKSIVEKEEG